LYLYASVADMIERFGAVEMSRVSVVDGPVPAQPAPARIEAMLRVATAIADSYLRARYAVPVAPVPPELARAVAAIARHDLWTGGDRVPADDVRYGHDQAIAYLKQLATGAASLDGAALASAAAAPAGAAAIATDRPRDVSTETMRGLV
jgi:phage gp36-like protein